ncbi:glycosyltransferase family 2 protein [Xanthobacter sp. VNH20]|uniref:glycosyltransferase family 2 protein n=1 Tax=Xanthobacter sp. VNH20 TaxID=3156616 RepID=UPI0032B4D51E
MRLASVTLARDEADIIEVFVRHNLHFVDCMYIIDDGSTDATRAILDLLQGEGLPVVRIEDGAHAAYNQGRRTTGLMHRAMQDEAWDFIFALDADEFITITDRATLEAELNALPEPRIGAFSVTHYFPHTDDDTADPNPLSRLTHVLDLPRGANKVIVPGTFAGHPETLISDGNHIISRWHAEQPMTLLATADLAHFPVRSNDQLVAKCMVSYIRWRARPDYKASTASHHIDGARALMEEPGLLLERPDRLLLAYIPQLDGPVAVRPFAQRRASPRYLDLARTYPYRRVLASLDALVEGARAGTAELNALRVQVTKAQAPFHVALAAALRKTRRSFLKRWLSLRAK